MAVLGAKSEAVDQAQLLDDLPRLLPKRGFALEGVKHDALDQLAQRKLRIEQSMLKVLKGLAEYLLLGGTGVRATLGTMPRQEPEMVLLEPWVGPWSPEDPDANYKAEIALYATQDPLATLRALGEAIGVPVGALARYVLARYATSGSGGLLELGPSMVHRLWEPVEKAEAQGTDEARLVAYDQLRQMISWLRLPLVEEAGYPSSAGPATTDGAD